MSTAAWVYFFFWGVSAVGWWYSLRACRRARADAAWLRQANAALMRELSRPVYRGPIWGLS